MDARRPLAWPGTTYLLEGRVADQRDAASIHPWSPTRRSGPSRPAGSSGPPAAPSNPDAVERRHQVSSTESRRLTGRPALSGTTFNVAFGTSPTRQQVATGLTSAPYTTRTVSAPTRPTSGESRPSRAAAALAGPIVVVHDRQQRSGDRHRDLRDRRPEQRCTALGRKASDATAADGVKLPNAGRRRARLNAPLANPPNYFEDSRSSAPAGTRYRLWLRIHAHRRLQMRTTRCSCSSPTRTVGRIPTYPLGTTPGCSSISGRAQPVQSLTGGAGSATPTGCRDTGDVWFQNHAARTRCAFRSAKTASRSIRSCSARDLRDNAPGPVEQRQHDRARNLGRRRRLLRRESPNPATGATGVSLRPTLTWTSSGATSYDVLFGTANPPPHGRRAASDERFVHATACRQTRRTSGRSSRATAPGSTTGPIWSFTTVRAAADPPSPPSTESCASGATGIS